MYKWMMVGLLVAAAEATTAPAHEDKPKAPEGVSIELSVSVAEYDPNTPSTAVMTCVLHNNSKQTVMAPVGYDWETVVLQSGLLTLQRGKRDVKLVAVDPGKDQVVFELPLDDILMQGTPKDKGWNWQWFRRQAPPLSPIHKYRGTPGFEEMAEFRAEVQVGADKIASGPAVLKVKLTKPPD